MSHPLDALRVAADHHTLLFENEHVRVLETLIPPGQKTAVHVHPWPGVAQILEDAHIVRYDGEGNVTYDSRQAGPRPDTHWFEPIPEHAVENVDDHPLRVRMIELKGALPSRSADS